MKKRMILTALAFAFSFQMNANGATQFSQLPEDTLYEIIANIDGAKTLSEQWQKIAQSLQSLALTNKNNKAMIDAVGFKKRILALVFNKYPAAITTREGNVQAVKIIKSMGVPLVPLEGKEYALTALIDLKIWDAQKIGPFIASAMHANCLPLERLLRQKNMLTNTDEQKIKTLKAEHEFLYQSLLFLAEHGFEPNNIVKNMMKRCEDLLKD